MTSEYFYCPFYIYYSVFWYLISFICSISCQKRISPYDLSCKIKQAVTQKKEGSWFEPIYLRVSKIYIYKNYLQVMVKI